MARNMKMEVLTFSLILYQSKNCGHRIHVLIMMYDVYWYCQMKKKRMSMKILKKEWFIWKFWKKGASSREQGGGENEIHAPCVCAQNMNVYTIFVLRTYLIGWNFMRGNIWIDAFYKPQLHTLTQFYQKYPSWFKFTRSWSWSHGRWIYNYLYNQCLSPLKLWVRTPLMARCTRYNIMW